MYIMIISALNIETEQSMKLMQKVQEKDHIKQTTHDYNEIFENLEEGIVLFSQNKINFCNHIFNEILFGLKVIQDPQ